MPQWHRHVENRNADLSQQRNVSLLKLKARACGINRFQQFRPAVAPVLAMGTSFANRMIRSVGSQCSTMATFLRGPSRPSCVLRVNSEERVNELIVPERQFVPGPPAPRSTPLPTKAANSLPARHHSLQRRLVQALLPTTGQAADIPIPTSPKLTYHPASRNTHR